MTELDTYTVEELQHSLAHVVAHAREEELNDDEV
jgi:hypothetical protein